MSILDIFEDLDNLYENYNGSYKSPYLNISDVEQKKAKQKHQDNLIHGIHINKRGQFEFGFRRYVDTYHVIDYEIFHKAYDVELTTLDLLSCFDADGKLGPRATWGNLKRYQNKPEANNEAYRRLVDLWSLVHGTNERGKLFDQWQDLQRIRNNLKTMDELKTIQQAIINSHEAELKTAETTKDKILLDLNTKLAAAFDKLNPDLVQGLKDYNNDDTCAPEVILDKDETLYKLSSVGDIKYTFYLVIPGFAKLYISPGDIEAYDEARFKQELEKVLVKDKIELRIAEKVSGLEILRNTFKKTHIASELTCFFVNLETDEIYSCDEKFEIKDTKGAPVTLDQLNQTALIFVHYYVSEWGSSKNFAPSWRGMSMSYVTKGFYSWASDFENHPKISAYIPEELVNLSPCEGNQWHGTFGKTEKYSSHDHKNMKGYGIEYEGIDTWALQDAADVHILSGTDHYNDPKEWDWVVAQIKSSNSYDKAWTIKF